MHQGKHVERSTKIVEGLQYCTVEILEGSGLPTLLY